MDNLGVSTSECLYCQTPLHGAQTHFCCLACESLYQLETSPDKGLSSGRLAKSLEKHQALSSLAERELGFYIEGLQCSSCVHLLERLPEFDSGIASARVNFADSTLHVRLNEAGSWSRVAAIVEELGYAPTALQKAQDLFKKRQRDNRQSLMRIGVAGACAGNMMLFVVPVYAGLAGKWAHIFNAITFVLFLPILLYSAVPFYQGAWNFLKYRSVNADLPITIALLSGFALSTFNLWRGEGPVYYDSTASFLFLILSSRYLLKRVQQKYLSRDTLLEGLHNRSDLVAGQILRVYQGEKIPADGVLTSTQAEVDMSLFNGESLPEIFHQGMALNAGSVLLSKDAEMRVEKVGLETRLGQLLLQLQADSVQKSRLMSLTDRLSQILIVTVMLLALAFFLFSSQYDLNQALERALALIVIACPCALAFGSPLAYGLGLRKAQKQGILIRNPDVFERLKDIQNIFFDKTGTLTEGQLKLVSIDGEIRPEERAIILALELHSLHPVAFALRREWSATASLPAVESSHEITGDGVYGKINGTEYSLTRSKELNILDFLAVEFRVDGRLKAHLFFEDPLRMESPSILKSLSNYQLHILSGDKKNRVLKTAALCEIPEANCYAELTPEQKKSFVLLSPGSCMIGDGVNDALALKAAEVGIAVKGSVDLSLMSADVYFTRGGLRPFYDLLKIATQARRTLRRNLAISLIYNILGGILALGGFVNPMVAAILMPISSVLIVISSLRGVQ